MKQITMHIGITVLHPVAQAVVFSFVFITVPIILFLINFKVAFSFQAMSSDIRKYTCVFLLCELESMIFSEGQRSL